MDWGDAVGDRGWLRRPQAESHRPRSGGAEAPSGCGGTEASSHREFARAEFVIYLLACVAIRRPPPGGGGGERGRAGTAVLAVGFLIMPVMVIRVQQVWAGPVG